MAELPILYTVRMDFAPEVEEEANRWNNTDHVSDLLGAGFLSAARYRSVHGAPSICHVYELPSVDVLSSEAYVNVRKPDPRVAAGFSNHSVSVYSQVVAVNVPETPRSFASPRSSTLGGVDARYLMTVGMDVPPDSAEELVRWHREELIPNLLKAKGIANGRLCRRAGYHPVAPCLDPEWVAIFEMDSLEPLRDPIAQATGETEWAKRMGAKISDKRFGALERIFPE